MCFTHCSRGWYVGFLYKLRRSILVSRMIAVDAASVTSVRVSPTSRYVLCGFEPREDATHRLRTGSGGYAALASTALPMLHGDDGLTNALSLAVAAQPALQGRHPRSGSTAMETQAAEPSHAQPPQSVAMLIPTAAFFQLAARGAAASSVGHSTASSGRARFGAAIGSGSAAGAVRTAADSSAATATAGSPASDPHGGPASSISVYSGRLTGAPLAGPPSSSGGSASGLPRPILRVLRTTDGRMTVNVASAVTQVNAVAWHRQCGTGYVYGTRRGHLRHMVPPSSGLLRVPVRGATASATDIAAATAHENGPGAEVR